MADEIRLPNLSANAPIVGSAGLATTDFRLFLKKTKEAIEAQLTDLNQAIEDIEETLAIAVAALATAEEAEAKADEALAGGGEMSAATSLQLSQPLGITITATDIGGSAGANLDISAHIRRYGNGDQVSVNADPAVDTLAYDLPFFIYYDQASRLGGAVTYVVTATEADAYSSSTNPNRHYVGAIHTPTDGGPPTTGTPGTRS